MDIPRPDQTKAKRKKRILYTAVTAVVLVGITVLLARLKPAAPTVTVTQVAALRSTAKVGGNGAR